MTPSGPTRSLYLHVGLPKTATTSLQGWLFPFHPEICYPGTHKPNEWISPDEIENGWLKEIVAAMHEGTLPRLRPLGRTLSERGVRAGAQRVLLSEEGFLGGFLAPVESRRGHLGPDEAFSSLRDYLSRSSFAGVRVIAVLRDQEDFLESFFAQYFHVYRRRCGIRGADEFVRYALDGAGRDRFEAVLRYERLADALASSFGPQNVRLLRFEQLRNDPVVFLDAITDFMGVDPWTDERIRRFLENRENVRTVNERGRQVKELTFLEVLKIRAKKHLPRFSRFLGRRIRIQNRDVPLLNRMYTSVAGPRPPTFVRFSESDRASIRERYSGRDEWSERWKAPSDPVDHV